MDAIKAPGRPIPELDPKNDARHALGEHPLARESVPYVLSLPEHGVCMFTYTWVNRENLAGSIFVAFGPGIGEQPIVEAIDNVKMSEQQNFDEWTVGCVHLKQDLKLDRAEVRVQCARATLEMSFESLHRAYAYGFHAEGCPPYAATNRLEQAGRIKGVLRVNGKTMEFDTTGARDHSWGTRDWQMPQHWKWLHAQTKDGTCVHFWEINARGRTDLRGYVFRDKLLAEVSSVAVDFEVDAQYQQKSISAVVKDSAGRSITVEGDFFAHYHLIPGPHTTLIEGGLKCHIDGAPGVGWAEFMWPTPYLDYLRTAQPSG